ncbi:MAG TPA: cation acetate symporter [Candidatus Deferrimicrobium sp.]|nr:cation acetate symporter [Candidatus Deferrimicrobium sp.]
MIYSVSPLAIILFVIFVLFVLGISFYFGNKTKSSAGYYAAGGTIHWGVNGIAFAGDYLSAASFLGICGMIAFSGYDGFLYSIGYLAGWVVALFVVAEPLKRMGKYTFADALDSTFNNKGIQLTAAISTLIVSICYLIPQMVGAGDLVTPLLGMPHWVGVILVGGIVIFIVATAGMTSTTYVQFIKGGLLIIFSTILTVYLISHGLAKKPYPGYHDFKTIPTVVTGESVVSIDSSDYKLAGQFEKKGLYFVKLEKAGIFTWWKLNGKEGAFVLEEALSKTNTANGTVLYNGEPQKNGKFYQVGHFSKLVKDGQEVEKADNLDPFSYISTIEKSEIVSFAQLPVPIEDGGDRVTVWYQKITPGSAIMRPGLKFKVDKGATPWSKLNFISLMLALFFGTAALPHILIRYYTVPSAKDARKSTIVAIAAIGFFYILTLYMGLGAMANGVLDVESSNMSAPLLAKYFGIGLFSIISAIAFATVLGTVSGLIVASSGAVAHDLMDRFFNLKMTDKGKVKAGKIAAVVVGGVAIVLGILFKGMNVSFLVGWAFSVAASANLPAILMLLFWKKTTAKGIAYSIVVGIVSSLTIILLSPEMFEKYGVDPATAPIPLSNPGIISIPLGFLTLIVVSLITKKKETEVPVKK